MTFSRRQTKEKNLSLWEVNEKSLLDSLDNYFTPKSNGTELKSLQTQFNESLRVKELKGKSLESEKSFRDALSFYDDLLKSTPEKDGSRMTIEKLCSRRKVSVLKAQGKLKEASNELNKHLTVYQSDTSAWHELALLNLEILDYSAAMYCLEEVMLLSPGKHNIFLCLCECLLSSGDEEALAARSYASTALYTAKRNKSKFSSIRGELDLLVATSRVTKNDDHNKKLNNLAFSELSSVVEKKEVHENLREAFVKVIGEYKV